MKLLVAKVVKFVCRPPVVDISEAVETYPANPRPWTVELKLLVTKVVKFVCRTPVVDISEAVETYPANPRPVTVDCKFKLDRKPAVLS